LGIIGSSGRSTDPHLHFMVQDSNFNLIEPYKGTCNNISESLWNVQAPYYDSGINDINTHATAIQYNTCPQSNQLNEQDLFYQSDLVRLSASLKAARTIHSLDIQIFNPSGILMANSNYDIPSWHPYPTYEFNYNVPFNAPVGEWTYRIIMRDQGNIIDTYQVPFWVTDQCPSALVLNGIQNENKYNFAENWIVSSQEITNNAKVNYESDLIILSPGFRTTSTLQFKASSDFICPGN
ncbi:MAG: hypothetical protein AAGK97_07775, partial [Bacteroidota bacterium]